jgi:glycosyltransferase involved in cell wall biosynthesis
MKVLLVTGEYPPMQGGVGDYTKELGKAFANLGVETHVLTQGPGEGDDTGPITVHRLHRWGWHALGAASSLVRRLKPNAVQIQYQAAAYGMHPSIHLLPRWLRLTAKQTLVSVTYHDLLVPYLFPKAGPLRWHAVLEMARSSHLAVTTNPADYRRLTAALPHASVEEIPIGSNIHPAPPKGFRRDAWRVAHGYTKRGCLLIYFGFLNASKGGDILVDALSMLKSHGGSVKLVMLGGRTGSSDPTNEDFARNVEQLMQERGVMHLVRWTGFLPPEEVSAWLLSADVAILPYRDGVSFRRGSFMAMLAHGLPVVTTEPEVPHRELKHRENVVLVPRGDARAVADAVAELCRSPELRARISAGAKALSGLFSWDRIARMHLEAYQALEGPQGDAGTVKGSAGRNPTHL